MTPSGNAPRRAWIICAKIALIRAIPWRRKAQAPHVAQLSAHLAQDIGLTPAEVARQRLRWPSETNHHPGL